MIIKIFKFLQGLNQADAVSTLSKKVEKLNNDLQSLAHAVSTLAYVINEQRMFTEVVVKNGKETSTLDLPDLNPNKTDKPN